MNGNLKNAVFALLAVADANKLLSLGHLFSVVLGKECKKTACCEEAKSALAAGLTPEVLIVFCPGKMQAAIALIQYSKKFREQAVTIAINPGNDPEFEVRAFEAGADDVVRSSFTMKEFAYRLRARLNPTIDLDSELANGLPWETEFMISSRAKLTTAEAQIAHVLLERNGQVVSRNDLSKAIDHRPWTYGDRKFDVHVATIRKKLRSAFGLSIRVSTVRAKGYRLSIQGTESISGEFI